MARELGSFQHADSRRREAVKMIGSGSCILHGEANPSFFRAAMEISK
jgi:hypothetical protein